MEISIINKSTFTSPKQFDGLVWATLTQDFGVTKLCMDLRDQFQVSHAQDSVYIKLCVWM